MAGLYVLYFRYAGFGEDAIVNGIISLVICQTTYFQLKHLIIPDVEGGIIRSIRGYNLMALIYAVLCMAEMIVSAIPGGRGLLAGVWSAMCLVLLLFIPVPERGIEKWTT